MKGGRRMTAGRLGICIRYTPLRFVMLMMLRSLFFAHFSFAVISPDHRRASCCNSRNRPGTRADELPSETRRLVVCIAPFSFFFRSRSVLDVRAEKAKLLMKRNLFRSFVFAQCVLYIVPPQIIPLRRFRVDSCMILVKFASLPISHAHTFPASFSFPLSSSSSSLICL